MSKLEELRTFVITKVESKAITKTALSLASGVDQASITRFSKNQGGLSAANFIKLSGWAGWTIESETVRRMGVNSPCIVVGENGKLVDVYHVAGAGQGWEIVETDPLKTIRVPLSFATQISFALLVDGDSMYPTLKSGSVVGVVRKEPFVGSEIYAVRPPDEGIAVKRVIFDYERDGYILRSDNEDKGRYTDVFIPKSLSSHLIVGRVVWVWQGV